RPRRQAIHRACNAGRLGRGGGGCRLGGLVAFVGLAAPHIARWLVGPMHRPLLPASALVGAIIVTFADAIARAALPPSEIPLGLITAVAGGPFFILLLAHRLRT